MNNQFDDLFTYDPETGNLFWKVSRGRVKAGSEVGTINVHGYLQVKCLGKDMLVHRVVWQMHNTEKLMPEIPLDHINGLKTDNRIENLRIASIQTNNMNKRAMSNCKTGVRGVYKKGNRFIVELQGRQVGSCKTLDEATKVYQTQSELLYGEFAPSKGCGHAI